MDITSPSYGLVVGSIPAGGVNKLKRCVMEIGKKLLDRQVLETKYKNARGNLLVVLAFTAINIVLLVTQSDTYFLFSAYIPYALVSVGMILCGMFPAEYYGEEFAGVEFYSSSIFAVFLAVAIVIMALYLISWIFSKKKKVGWMIFALVLFAIDTAGMLIIEGIALDSIFDIAFHVWVIVSLIQGIKAYSKLKKLLEEQVEILEEEQQIDS